MKSPGGLIASLKKVLKIFRLTGVIVTKQLACHDLDKIVLVRHVSEFGVQKKSFLCMLGRSNIVTKG